MGNDLLWIVGTWNHILEKDPRRDGATGKVFVHHTDVS